MHVLRRSSSRVCVFFGRPIDSYFTNFTYIGRMIVYAVPPYGKVSYSVVQRWDNVVFSKSFY